MLFALCMVLMWFPLQVGATAVSIRIFADARHSRMQFTAELGSYQIQGADGRIVRELAEGESLEMSVRREVVGFVFRRGVQGNGIESYLRLAG